MVSLSTALIFFQDLFVKHGGKILDGCKVTGIVPGSTVAVKTNKGSFRAKRLILTTGAWTNSLLDNAGIGLNLDIKVCMTLCLYELLGFTDAC